MGVKSVMAGGGGGGGGGDRSSCGLNRSERTIVQYGGLLCTSMTAHIFEHRQFTAIAEKVDMLVDERFEHARQEHDHINLGMCIIIIL